MICFISRACNCTKCVCALVIYFTGIFLNTVSLCMLVINNDARNMFFFILYVEC